MRGVLIVAITLLYGFVPGKCEECCPFKTVGKHNYFNVAHTGPVPGECLNKCAYIREGEHTGPIYCFAAGHEPTTCHGYTATTTEGTTLSATCDNFMKVYFDGVLQFTDANFGTDTLQWKNAATLQVPADVKEVAIECQDAGAGDKGIYASTSDGVLTDSSWVCTTNKVAGWATPGNNGFSPAVDVSLVRPIQGVSSNAKWIWGADLSSDWTGCKKQIGTEGSTYKPLTGGSTYTPSTEGSTYAPSTEGSTYTPSTGGSTYAPSTGGSTYTPSTIRTQNAVLIIGGWDNPGNAEVFFPDTAIGCSVPFYSFRDKVHSTTMDTFGDKTLICGGGGSSKECFQFTPVGSATAWRKYSDLNITRYEHTSWASTQGPVLIGGYEPFGKNAEKTAELNGRILPFSLPSTRDACAITDSDTDSVIVTGGAFTKIKASRYNLNGLVEELPTLNRGRDRHGCGSYTSSNKLVLIVAGGDNAGGKTTEKFIIGDTAWTFVGNLPRSTFWISGATISMNNKIYIFGGDEEATNRDITDILEYEAEQDTWNKVGDMKRGRYRHATAVIEADQASLCATK